MPLPALIDEEYLALSRSHINGWLRTLPLEDRSVKVLEIGPKIAWPWFDTLDIDPAVRPTILGDICDPHLPLADCLYDLVLCISVLEHVYDPVQAIANVRRVLKPSGIAAFQGPLNFRQHGPQPDLWRFTENGWRYMLRDWEIERIDTLDSPDRPLFPITYAITAGPNSVQENGVLHLLEWGEPFRPAWIDR